MQQLDINNKTKEEYTIDFIRKHEPKEGYMGCYSGGKDSEVLKHLVLKSGVSVKWYYSLMPDPPDVLRHIRKNHPDVKFLRPKFSFWAGVRKYYPPHRWRRWCCNKIKEAPSKKVPLKHRLLGIRAEESKTRAKQGWINQITKKRINYHPIFNWYEWEIWDYIKRYNIKYCSLYDEGFSRLGCVVCPMRSSKETKKYKQRFPAQYKLFEKSCRIWWDNGGWFYQRRRGYAALFSEFMERWYQGK